MNKESMKSIASLKTTVMGKNLKNVFLIDLYQRGYRWTKREIQALLEDIAEFMDTDSEGFYCLQPLTVNTSRVDGENYYWNVIDGQQRLTTIYLIYLYWFHQAEKLPFVLDYPDRSEMKNLLKKMLQDSALSLQDESVSQWTEYDINCFYVWTAYKIIKNWFKNKEDTFVEKFKNTFQDVRMLWYDLKVPPEKESQIFRDMNSGKILLSNDELIKGLLLRRDKQQINEFVRSKIAFEWNLIESFLADNRLFACLVRKEYQQKYTARIGFVFDVLATKYNQAEKLQVSEGSATFSFDVFYEYLKKNDFREESLTALWNEVTALVAVFKEWYKNPSFYNRIGFLVNQSSRSVGNQSIKSIVGIVEKYQTGKPEEFKRYLQDSIKNGKTFKSKVPLSRSYLNILINELKHNEHNDVIHNILLLYNIAYLQADAYFDFDKYQNICWNLEDINATADKELHFSNLDEAKNPRKQWLEEILALHIDHGAFASLKKEAQQALDRRSYLYKDDPAFKLEENSLYLKVIHYFCGKKIEEWGSSLGNLTLLDENTNKHYHNDLFPCKREKILKRVQRGFFIPPCTLKVFMKSFDGMGNTLMWTKEDAEIYKKDILDTISVYLEIPA